MYKIAPRFLLGLSMGLAALVGAGGISGCHKAPDAASVPDNSGPDPADANMAPVDNSQPQQAAPSRVLGIRSQAPAQQSSEQYAPAPADQQAQQAAPPPPDQSYSNDQAAQDAQDYNQLTADADGGQPSEYADEPPPPLPVYEQPEAPEPNYLWTPGYWGWGGSGGYYWVPGVWCPPPYYGALSTPPYWGF